MAAKKADFNQWAEDLHISPLLARIIRNRDLTEEDQVKKFLYGSLEDCYSPWLLKDMEKAVDIIIEAIENQTAIRIIGDYDVDGICSAYILTKGLQVSGAKADTAIPHRIHDGYGLNDSLIEEAHSDGIGLLITCDNGIAATPQVALAVSYGMQVIVTDHHEVPFEVIEADGRERRVEKLPPALAVIDPKQEACGYPFPGICGAVVAYKVIVALQEKTKSGALKSIMDELLEFAAFATVCDVMELKDENRILVKEGLKRMRSTGNPGLRSLMEVNQLEPAKLNVFHLGFVLGPCLNATGRLDTAKRALELLQSTSGQNAMMTARELKELNDSRKTLTAEGVEKAMEYMEQRGIVGDKVLVIYLPEVHESLAGIIAGRIREKYNHPVFLLTRGEEGVKGSGRSIEGYHMYEAMNRVSHLFTKFGGHAMAAGLSMEEGNIEILRQELNRTCELGEEDFIPKVLIDVPMPLDYGSQELARELELLEPFGVGNPKPLFAQKDLTFLSGYKMGANKSFARYTVLTPEGSKKQLIFFGDIEKFGAFLNEKYGAGSEEKLYAGRLNAKVSVVYQLGLNSFRGKTEVQYLMQHYC